MGNCTTLRASEEGTNLYVTSCLFIKSTFKLYPHTLCIGLSFMEIMTTHFFFDNRYSQQLSHNFRMILRGVGSVVSGDKKLLLFTGIFVTLEMYMSILSCYRCHTLFASCLLESRSRRLVGLRIIGCATKVDLADKKVKFIGAVNPQLFPSFS